ncbi:MAG: methyltransferase [bacterium]
MLEKIILGLKTVKRVIYNSLFLRFKDNLKLNLGAGGVRMKNYINVDSLFMRETDLLCELKNLPLFIKHESVSEIYASHIFEHFSENEVRVILKLCHKLLKEGGELRISVPDMDKIVKIYNKNWDHFQKRGNAPWNGLIYGGQSSEYDFHKTGFNLNWLTLLLEEAGFKKISEYDPVKFTKSHGISDASLANEPFKEPISLNIVTVK